MKPIQITALCLAAAGLTACATAQPALPAAHNTAVKTNIAAQAITPPAAQKGNRNIPQNRTLRDAARERYRTDSVKEPVKPGTN